MKIVQKYHKKCYQYDWNECKINSGITLTDIDEVNYCSIGHGLIHPSQLRRSENLIEWRRRRMELARVRRIMRGRKP